jgi:hypothetical protein
MRIFFRSLAILDLLATIIIGMQLYYILGHFDEKVLRSEKVEAILMFPMFFLVLGGAIGLFFLKRIGFILYYIQFPFRLYLLVFTLGFITLLPEALENYDDKWPMVLKKICFVAEVIRLYQSELIEN